MKSNPESSVYYQDAPPFTVVPEESLLDLRRFFGLFLSNWYWFAVTLFVSGMFVYGINTYSERVYSVSSLLLINDDQGGADMTGLERLLPGGDIFRNQQNLKNEIGILKSFSLNKSVIQELPDFHVSIVGLGRRGIFENRYYKTAPFKVEFLSLDSQRINIPISIKILDTESYSIEVGGVLIKDAISFGDNFSDAGFNFTLVIADSSRFKFSPENSNRFIITFRSIESLANEYRNKLIIDPVSDDATLVRISVNGVVPLQESEYLNKLMDVYIARGLDFKNSTAQNTIEFIDEQLQVISDSLIKAENKLEQFRRSNKIIDLSQEGTDIKNKLEVLNQEKIGIKIQKKYFEYLQEYIRSRNETGELISPSIWGITDPLLTANIENLSRLQVQKRELKYSFNESQPAIRFIENQVDEARQALAENIRNSVISADRILLDMERRQKEIEDRINILPGTERRFINIQREFDLNNTVYTYMLEKRSEASIARASRVSNNRIIDKAEPFNATTIEPKRRKNYILGIILGLFFPGLYIFIVDRLHNKIIDKKDIEKGTDAPVIGFVGHNFNKHEIPVFKSPGSSLAESFRTIRTNLKFYLNGESKAVISIASTLSGEGKTFVSTNLSVAMASLGKKTLLVGLDLRKPRMHKILGTTSETGLSSFLIGESRYEEIIFDTGIPNLSFVPSGQIPPNPAELIESDLMQEFMARAKREYDYVILDTPPIGIVSDGLLLGQFTDINLFVVRQRYSFVNTLDLIQHHFLKKNLKNVAIIVNDINTKGYYGYGLRYGYGFYEGYGYNYGHGQYGYNQYGNGGNYYIED